MENDYPEIVKGVSGIAPDAPSFLINPLYILEDSGSPTNRSIVDLFVDLPEPAFCIF